MLLWSFKLTPTRLTGSKHPSKLLLTNTFVVRSAEIMIKMTMTLKLLKWSLLNCVPYVLTCLRAHVATCLACLHSHVPTCFACLRPHVPMCLACLSANMPCVLTCQHALRDLCVYVLACYNSNNKDKFQ